MLDDDIKEEDVDLDDLIIPIPSDSNETEIFQDLRPKSNNNEPFPNLYNNQKSTTYPKLSLGTLRTSQASDFFLEQTPKLRNTIALLSLE